VIAWLTRRFSRDPGQLGLFDGAPSRDASGRDLTVRDLMLRESSVRPAPPAVPERTAPASRLPADTCTTAPPRSARPDAAVFLQQLKNSPAKALPVKFK
jgi:hypothetical protein